MFQDSVLHCVQKLRDGDRAAAQRLWEAYYCRLVGLARQKLDGRARLVSDEEDVALSAIKSFCRGVERGRYPQLADREGLWNLLVTITLHKVLHLVRDEGRAKRGGGRKRIAAHASNDDAELLAQLVSKEPTPQIAVQIIEEIERLMHLLPQGELAELALLKMEGYTNQEIAGRWQKTERTVERKLHEIRRLWSEYVDRATTPPIRKIVLTVVAGPDSGQSFSLDHNDTFRGGRDPAAQVRLSPDDKTISRFHFQLEVDLPHCRLTNLSSTNGTLVNGQAVSVTDLQHGDIILVGGTAIRVSMA